MRTMGIGMWQPDEAGPPRVRLPQTLKGRLGVLALVFAAHEGYLLVRQLALDMRELAMEVIHPLTEIIRWVMGTF